MFGGFAHYLFGGAIENAEATETETGSIYNKNEDDDLIDSDGDWILIEMDCEEEDEEGGEGEGEGEGEGDKVAGSDQQTMPNVNLATTLIVPKTAIAQQQLSPPSSPSPSSASSDSESDASSAPSSTSASPIPANTMMDESWFVTPPPCFTYTNPINIETTPFENLLIEHPSMSVFGPSLPVSSSLSSSPGSSSLPESSNSIIIEAPSRQGTVTHSQQLLPNQSRQSSRRQQQQQNVQQRNRNNANNNLNSNLSATARAGLLTEWRNVLTPMQKAENMQVQKCCNKSYLDRQNKVVQHQNRHPNRKAKMMARPNGVCNNRKCC